MRAADCRLAPRCRARRRQRLASVQASWFDRTSQSPSLASNSNSSSPRRARIVTCRGARILMSFPHTKPPHLGSSHYYTRLEDVSVPADRDNAMHCQSHCKPLTFLLGYSVCQTVQSQGSHGSFINVTCSMNPSIKTRLLQQGYQQLPNSLASSWSYRDLENAAVSRL